MELPLSFQLILVFEVQCIICLRRLNSLKHYSHFIRRHLRRLFFKSNIYSLPTAWNKSGNNLIESDNLILSCM